jgi:4-hydroxythreonine-4-phosphate dehydrogenase
MMLADDGLRVALVTTHVPLAEVPAAVTPAQLEHVLRTVDRHCRERLAIRAPRLRVLGLNPHAGESGHLGREEIDVIEPVLETLRAEGLLLEGPLPADTAFDRAARGGFDVIVAMYHDQGLAPLKAEAFGRIVNVTLGLPIVRTSVDHGTALDLATLPAGTPPDRRARLDSLHAALAEAHRQLRRLAAA